MVTIPQIIFGALLILVLLLAAGLFALRQRATLRRLKSEKSMSEAEANYLRKQAKRRLWCSVAMVLLAVLLTGAMIFLEAPAQRLADQADQLPDQEFTENQKSFARFYTWYWITFFLVLLSMLIMAGIDVVATRRYAKEQYQRIQRERRALIEQEAAHIRNRTTRL